MVEPSLLTSAEVARMFGVTATTVKRWADSGLLECEKTLGKHRRFSVAEVERFKHARPENRETSANDSATWVDDFLLLLREAPTPSAIEGRLFEMHARSGRWSVVADALCEALREIGERWVRGHLSILDEHVMSERMVRAIARLADWLPRNPAAPRALLAVPDGDEHTIGLALTELCFREQGWDTLWFGRRTPLSELPAEIARHSSNLGAVALSASVVCSDAQWLAREVFALENACRPQNVMLVLGGRGAWPEHPAYATKLASFSGLGEALDLRRANLKSRLQGVFR